MPVNRIAHLLTQFDMPRREKQEKVALGTYISEDLYGLLQEYHEESGIPITRLVEDALRALLTARYRTGHKSEDDGPDNRKGGRRK